MKRLISLFMCQYQVYLDLNNEYDPQVYPKRLITELDPQNPDNVLSAFVYSIQSSKKSQISGLQMMHKLTTISLLFLHSDKFYQIMTNILPLNLENVRSQDKWLKQNFLQPYQQFLLKCCTSWEMYSKVKQKNLLSLEQQFYNFNTVFYIINLLGKLFPAIDKISHLARYYSKVGGYSPKLFTFVGALQALRLYTTLKTIILQMINNPGKYMPSRKQQKVMKGILGEYIIQINESMKNIILNKYYAPYKQGIKTKLFRNQEQEQKTFKVINGILNSHRDTQRQHQRKMREKTLIDYADMVNNSNQSNGSFRFNPKLMEYSLSMSNYSQMSVMGLSTHMSPLKSRCSNILSSASNACIKSQNQFPRRTLIVQHEHQQFDDEEEEDQSVSHNIQAQQKYKQSAQKNQSTQQADSPQKTQGLSP